MAQGSVGKVRAFEDFTAGIAQTLSDATEYVSPSGEWRMAAISGDVAMTIETDEPNGVASFSGAGAAGDGVAFFTLPYQPSTQGVMSVEFRWQSGGVSDYRFFAGWQETVAVAEPVNPFTLSGTSLTDEGETLGALGVRANVTVAANSYNVARIILEPDGRAEAWYGIGTGRLQKVATLRGGTLDTTAFYHPILLLSCHSTGDPLYSVDYLLSEGGRSWAA